MKNILTISILFFTLVANAQNDSMEKIKYTMLEFYDGSNNYYKITQDSIYYQPVTPELSSSGIYSGGEPLQKAISIINFLELYLEFERIFKNKEIHGSKRIKTSGKLRMTASEAECKEIILIKSYEMLGLKVKLSKLLE